MPGYSNGDVPENAIATTYYGNREKLFVGRISTGGNCFNVGKIHPSHNVLYVAQGTQEVRFSSYEVLALRMTPGKFKL
jgi:hypothetical protein